MADDVLGWEWRRGRELNPRFTKGLFGDVCERLKPLIYKEERRFWISLDIPK
ncbi:MAG: hypothetical protein IAE77_24145 [Prosthecobacter sp.]|uniref:hypothetical protein n=1 Tax=Prosthecobacter sp. TaxID=1965333 RepID=UPI0019F8FF37|nr:hypothetical protein [Prosthecobacter sp.]MBE2286571.1 hypothetical protein [Prosthecobacter sp.]